MRRRRVVINPTGAQPAYKFMNENPSKFHARKMLACDWTMYFVYPQNNRGKWEIPSSCASCSLIGCRHDNKHLDTHIQVWGIPKYCAVMIKSLSEIMLRNGFKNFDDRRITKPKQSFISVLISN